MKSAPRADGISRRHFLEVSTASAIMVVAGAIIHPQEAWGLEAKALQPGTLRTLIRMSRDIYPHDKVADRFYAVAVKALDDKAVKDAATKTALEAGVRQLDEAAIKDHGVGYATVAWERQRVELLRDIEKDAFFQTVRGNLVVGLYNQKEIWPIFGYEGESASKGGYLARGFDDIAWL